MIVISANSAQFVLGESGRFDGQTFPVEFQIQMILVGNELNNVVFVFVEFENGNAGDFIVNGFTGVFLQDDFGSVDDDFHVTERFGVETGRNDSDFGFVHVDLNFPGLSGGETAGQDGESVTSGTISGDEVIAIVDLQGQRAIVVSTEPVLFDVTNGGVEVVSDGDSFVLHDQGKDDIEGVSHTDVAISDSFFGTNDVDADGFGSLIEEETKKGFLSFPVFSPFGGVGGFEGFHIGGVRPESGE